LALSFRKPFVTPRHPGLIEQASEATGVFYNPGELQELGEALRKIKALDTTRICLLAEKWIEDHSWTQIAEDSAGIIRRVASAKLQAQ
jgi:glycosyltransferase involved in cell wall biosynthesis